MNTIKVIIVIGFTATYGCLLHAMETDAAKTAASSSSWDIVLLNDSPVEQKSVADIAILQHQNAQHQDAQHQNAVGERGCRLGSCCSALYEGQDECSWWYPVCFCIRDNPCIQDNHIVETKNVTDKLFTVFTGDNGICFPSCCLRHTCCWSGAQKKDFYALWCGLDVAHRECMRKYFCSCCLLGALFGAGFGAGVGAAPYIT